MLRLLLQNSSASGKEFADASDDVSGSCFIAPAFIYLVTQARCLDCKILSEEGIIYVPLIFLKEITDETLVEHLPRKSNVSHNTYRNLHLTCPAISSPALLVTIA
jgi:hypothetical protein